MNTCIYFNELFNYNWLLVKYFVPLMSQSNADLNEVTGKEIMRKILRV